MVSPLNHSVPFLHTSKYDADMKSRAMDILYIKVTLKISFNHGMYYVSTVLHIVLESGRLYSGYALNTANIEYIGLHHINILGSVVFSAFFGTF